LPGFPECADPSNDRLNRHSAAPCHCACEVDASEEMKHRRNCQKSLLDFFVILFCRNIFWTFWNSRRMLGERSVALHQLCFAATRAVVAIRPLAPHTRRKNDAGDRGRKMHAKALTMLVSRKFSSPPARLNQGLYGDFAGPFLGNPNAFLGKNLGVLRFAGAWRGVSPRRGGASPPERGQSGETQACAKKREDFMISRPVVVVAGLVPAIHAAPLRETSEVGVFRTAWMPGTRPGRTRRGCSTARRHNQLRFPDNLPRPSETNPHPKRLISPARR
jgi:hypothetical protein